MSRPRRTRAAPVAAGRRRERVVAVAATAAGLCGLGLVVAYADVGSVVAAIRPIGAGGFLLVVLAQASLCAPLGAAWWTVAGQPRARLGAFAWASLVAEAAAALLPFSQVGGAAIGSRAAAVAGVRSRVAVGSNLADITLELAAQVAFTLAGAGYLAYEHRLAAGLPVLRAATLTGVGAALLLLLALLTAQKWGLKAVEFAVGRLAPGAADPAALTGEMRAIYRRPARLAAALALHLGAWLASAFGAWLILALIGWPRPFLMVAAMESLLLAVRNAAFMVPAALGVQEGAYLLLAPLLGLPSSTVIALSLLKRGRDVAIGVPALVSWQLLEVRRHLRRRPARRPT